MPGGGSRAIAFPSLPVHTPFVGGLSPEAAQHVAWLEQRGLASTTVYARARLLLGLQEWLACYGEARPRPAPGEGLAAADAGPGLLAATPDDLAAWRQSLALAPGGICCYVSHARQFYDWAITQGLLTSNPAAGLPVPKRPRRLPRPIATAELMTALSTAPPRIRPWIVLAAWAGLRAKEVALLRAECLILTAAPLVLVASDATKGIHERTVPLSEFAAAEMRAVSPGRGYVFPRRDGQPGPNTPHVVSQLVNEHLRGCGSSATMHQLRHWFLSAVYQESLDIRLVQELAGHRSPETTAGYAALSPGRAAAAVNAIPVPEKRLRVVS